MLQMKCPQSTDRGNPKPAKQRGNLARATQSLFSGGHSDLPIPPQKRPPTGQYQTTSPWHRLSAKTGCARAMQAGDAPAKEEVTIRTLKTWCLLAPTFHRKRHHAAAFIARADVPSADILDKKLEILEPQPEDPKNDADLDDEGSEGDVKAEATKAKQRAKQGPKPKEPQARPKQKLRPKPKLQAAAGSGSGANPPKKNHMKQRKFLRNRNRQAV